MSENVKGILECLLDVEGTRNDWGVYFGEDVGQK
jgi:hypothetical protein